MYKLIYLLLAATLYVSAPVNAAVIVDGDQVFMVETQAETPVQKKPETTVQPAPVDKQSESTSGPSKQAPETFESKKVRSVEEVLIIGLSGGTLKTEDWKVLGSALGSVVLNALVLIFK